MTRRCASHGLAGQSNGDRKCGRFTRELGRLGRAMVSGRSSVVNFFLVHGRTILVQENYFPATETSYLSPENCFSAIVNYIPVQELLSRAQEYSFMAMVETILVQENDYGSRDNDPPMLLICHDALVFAAEWAHDRDRTPTDLGWSAADEPGDDRPGPGGTGPVMDRHGPVMGLSWAGKPRSAF